MDKIIDTISNFHDYPSIFLCDNIGLSSSINYLRREVENGMNNNT